MSYVDAIHDKSAERIHVVERSPAGERIFIELGERELNRQSVLRWRRGKTKPTSTVLHYYARIQRVDREQRGPVNVGQIANSAIGCIGCI